MLDIIQKGRTMGKKIDQDKINKIMRLGREGNSAILISEKIGVNRSTVNFYLNRGQEETINVEVRKKVLEEALWEHFREIRDFAGKGLKERLARSTVVERGMISVGVFGLPSVGWGLAAVSEWERMYKWTERERHLLGGLREHTRDSLFWDYWDEWQGKVAGYERASGEIHDWVSGRVESCQLESRYLVRLGRECFAATLLETNREAFDPESVNTGNEAGHPYFREIWEEVRVGPAWSQLELETEKLKEEQKQVQLSGLSGKMSSELEILAMKRAFPGQCRLCPI